MIGRVLSMVRKDLLRQVRSPLGILLVLSFPLIFSALIALTFGSGAEPRIPKFKLLVQDLDESFVSGALISAAGSEQVAEYFDVRSVGEDGLARLRQNEAAALWRIPEGFQDDLLEGKPVELELVRNPAQGIAPEVVEQALTVLTEVLDASTRALREPLREMNAMIDTGTDPRADQVAALSTSFYEAIDAAGSIVMPPVITLEGVQLEDEDGEEQEDRGTTSLIFLVVLPGVAVWGLFLVGDMAMRDLTVESRLGTLRRQLAGPVPPAQVILAKALFTATLSSISLVVLASIGWAVSRRVVDLPGFLVLSAALILAVTGYAAVVYGGVTSERQAATISSVVLLVFAFLGGTFIQIDDLPGGVRSAAPFSPFYWGTTGYAKLIRDDAGLVEILPNAAVLGGLGILLLAVGSVLLGRKVQRGAA